LIRHFSFADPGLWHAANLLVGRHGADAPILAGVRAEEMMAGGDTEGWAMWKRIRAAIDELLRTEPREGERLH